MQTPPPHTPPTHTPPVQTQGLQIQVLFFAIARDRAGMDEVTLTVPDGATIDDAKTLIANRFPALQPILPYVRFALDEAFVVDLSQPLRAGATLAIIPPVAGGAPREAILDEPLDARAVEALVTGPDRGGLVTFSGIVRDHTGGHEVTRLEYESYRPMALKVMAGIRAEVEAAHPSVQIACWHRVGVLPVGEIAVVVAAASAHRAPAFAACQMYIDRLKEDVPIFKREVRGDGSVWVGMGP
ncbi:MAG: molybdopterin synthase catalytic subunit/molybdopterin converting factor small subunit [Bradymonadia bacterium]